MVNGALRWILDQKEVTCVIPGFKTLKQVENNLQAKTVPSFTRDELKKVEEFYQNQVKSHIRGQY